MLCGPPIDIEEQLEFLKPYHDKGKIYVSVPHPFAAMSGISLFGRKTVAEKGYQKVWEIMRSDVIDAVEQMNCAETLGPELKFDAEEETDQRKRLEDAKLPTYLSSPNLNMNLGDAMKAVGKKVEKGDDDHETAPLGWMCSYGWGYTKLTMPVQAQEMLISQNRKARPDEIVYSMSKGVFPGTDEKVLCEAIMFVKQTEKGPDIVDARKQTAMEKTVCGIKEGVPYTADLIVAEAKYFGSKIFGNKFMGKRYLEEVAKAKAWNTERPRIPKVNLAGKMNIAEGLMSLKSKIRTFKPKP